MLARLSRHFCNVLASNLPRLQALLTRWSTGPSQYPDPNALSVSAPSTVGPLTVGSRHMGAMVPVGLSQSKESGCSWGNRASAGLLRLHDCSGDGVVWSQNLTCCACKQPGLLCSALSENTRQMGLWQQGCRQGGHRWSLPQTLCCPTCPQTSPVQQVKHGASKRLTDHSLCCCAGSSLERGSLQTRNFWPLGNVRRWSVDAPPCHSQPAPTRSVLQSTTPG